MAEIVDFDVTDANNTARWPEGMQRSSINNSARADEGILARWYKDTDGSITSGGSANAYTVTSNRTIAALTNNTVMAFTSNFANTAAATLALNGLTAKAIRRPNGDALIADDIVSGQQVVVVYKSSPDYWQLLSPPAEHIFPARAYAESANEVSTSAVIPEDGTIPLISEGDEALTVAITLKRADSRVRVRFCTQASTGQSEKAIVTVFRSSTCLVARAVADQSGTEADWGGSWPVAVEIEEAPGSVGPHTYSVRVGTDTGTVEFNNNNFGTAERMTLVVEEIFI